MRGNTSRASKRGTREVAARFSLPDGWTYTDLQTQIEEAISDKYGREGAYDSNSGLYVSGIYPWLRNFDDTRCWYCLGGSDVYQESYSVDGTEVTLGDDQTEVIIQWKAVPSTATSEDEAVGYAVPLAANDIVRFDDGLVFVRTGKIFEAGDYPDKNFSITPEELAAAVRDFQPLPNKGAHVPTIFDGKMGNLEAVELAEDGKTLLGTISVPKWMQEVHGSEPLRASLEWRRSDKRIIGNTLIPNPRVADSALMAAFSAANPKEEVSQTFLSSLASTVKAMLAIPEKETTEMSTTNPPAVVHNDPPASHPVNNPAADPRIDRMDARMKAMNKREAALFAKELFNDQRVVAAQVPALTAVFEAVLTAEVEQTVQFADSGGQARNLSLMDAIKAVFEAGPKHNLNAETIPNETLHTLGGGRTDFSAATGGGDQAKEAGDGAREWASRQGPQTRRSG